jgi:methyltransferase (TIGR00027 family)
MENSARPRVSAPGTRAPSTSAPSTSAPSTSALTATAARAAHLIVDGQPPIFADSLAATFLGDHADDLLAYHRMNGTHDVLVGARTTVTTRSRYTEDRLAEAVRRGVTQYLILGAGLDSFAYRSPLARQVRVTEVDHPATQRWKRRLLTGHEISPEGDVRYVEADLEAGDLAARLAAAGFDFSRPALISWLGVTMYLTRPAIAATLAVAGRCAPGTELIAEYAVPEDLQDERGRQYAQLVAPALAERGEPWLTFLRPAEMTGLLNDHGFGDVTHIGPRDMVDAALWTRSDALRPARLFQLADARIRAVP